MAVDIAAGGRWAAIFTLTVGALLASPIAFADTADPDEVETFEGSCQFSGTLRQQPPLTNAPQPGEGVARADGICSGTLTSSEGDAQRLESSRASYSASASGTLSCGGGSPAGSGFIDFGGERLRFGFSEIRGPGVAAIRLDGAAGGSAAGTARVSDEEDPVQIVQNCSGNGLRGVRIHIDLATTSTISG